MKNGNILKLTNENGSCKIKLYTHIPDYAHRQWWIEIKLYNEDLDKWLREDLFLFWDEIKIFMNELTMLNQNLDGEGKYLI